MEPFHQVDLHIHSIYSDGSDTPEELLIQIRELGFDCFALTDHDAIDGCRDILATLIPGDPLFIPGVEFGCKFYSAAGLTDNENKRLKGKYHILGYQFDLDHPAINAMVQEAHNIRMGKMLDRFRFLNQKYNYDITQDMIDNMAKHANPGRPHFASMMVKQHWVESREEAFRQLEKYPGFRQIITPEHAIHAILEAQGIPVLAHAPYGDGSQKLTREQIRNRVLYLKKHGLMGLECFYSTYDQDTTDFLLSLAEELDLLVTCGSDYHGINKKIQLGELSLPKCDRLESFLQVIREKQNTQKALHHE